MTARASGAALSFLLASPLLGWGCHDPLTQVVVGVTSDLAVPGEVDRVEVRYQPGDAAPSRDLSPILGAPIVSFPVSAGFVSNGTYPSFSITVAATAIRELGPFVVVHRAATGIRFVDGQTRMLLVDLPRSCACDGTMCPHPDDHPECADLVGPDLQPLDPALAPRGPDYQLPGAPTTPPSRGPSP